MALLVEALRSSSIKGAGLSMQMMLESNRDDVKLEAMRCVTVMTANGKLTVPRSLFPHIVKNVSSVNPELKKLIHLYLTSFADQEPDLALLPVATLQKSLKNVNPLVRSSALKVLTSMRLDILSAIFMATIRNSVNDLSPYVRRTVAHSIIKIYRLEPKLREDLIEYIERLLNDKNSIVLSSAVASFEVVCPERLDLIHDHYRRFCFMLADCNEWGQTLLLKLLVRYILDRAKTNSTASPDHDPKILLRSAKPLLHSHNSAVVMAVIQLFMAIANLTDIRSTITRPLIRLLDGHREVQLTVLNMVEELTSFDSLSEELLSEPVNVEVIDSEEQRENNLELTSDEATSETNHATEEPKVEINPEDDLANQLSCLDQEPPEETKKEENHVSNGLEEIKDVSYEELKDDEKKPNSVKLSDDTDEDSDDDEDSYEEEEDEESVEEKKEDEKKKRDFEQAIEEDDEDEGSIPADGMMEMSEFKGDKRALFREIFRPYIKSFFVKHNDTTQVRLLKLRILTNLSSSVNVSQVLRELQAYVAIYVDDIEFVSAAIHAIGRCAIIVKEVAHTCLNGLTGLLSNNNEHIVSEAIVVLRSQIIDKKPSRNGVNGTSNNITDNTSGVNEEESNPRGAENGTASDNQSEKSCDDDDKIVSTVIKQVTKLMPTVTAPQARATILWILGEFCDKNITAAKCAPDVLRLMAKSFCQEDNFVKLRVLSLAARFLLFLDKEEKPELYNRVQLIASYLFSLAKYDTNHDVRDRGRFLKKLLEDEVVCSKVLNGIEAA